MSRIVVTGGAGFIGSNLARLAVARGHQVVVIDDLSTGSARHLRGMDIPLVEASVLDVDAVREALTGADSLVHLAAIGSVPRSIVDPWRTNDVNVNGTLAVLRAAVSSGVEHVLFSSSSSVYGRNPVLPKREREWVRPMSPYAVSKLAGEQYVLAHQESYGLRTLAFRLFNVYGPRQSAGHPYAAVIPKFVEALQRGRPLTIYGDGTQTRDFTYVGAVCATLLDAIERRVSHPEPVNLAFGRRISIADVISCLGHLLGREIAVTYEGPRTGDVMHSQASPDSLARLFPAAADIPLEEGMKRTLEWFDTGDTQELTRERQGQGALDTKELQA